MAIRLHCLVREIISKVQTMRKESGFVVTDHIIIGYNASERLNKVFANNTAEIASSTLADGIKPANSGAFTKEYEVNGEQFTLYLTKA